MQALQSGGPRVRKRSAGGSGSGRGPDLRKYKKLTEEHKALERDGQRTQARRQSPSQGGTLGVPSASNSSSKHTGLLWEGPVAESDPQTPETFAERLLSWRASKSGGAEQPGEHGSKTASSPGLFPPIEQGNPGEEEGARSGATYGNDGEGVPAEELHETPSDVFAAIQMLHNQFPKVQKKVDVLPIILKTQVYSVVKNRTDVDREVEVLKFRRRIRVFKLVTSGDDYAMMLWEDYTHQVRLARAAAAAKSPAEHLVVFDWFLERVLPAHIEVGISHALLWRLLSGPGQPPVREYHLSLLIQAGLLVRQLADTTAFWFAVPNVGLLVKSLVQGRKELVGYLSRRRYREMLQSELSRKTLRYSVLGMRFHLRDLLGSGKATTLSTTVGPLIRLAKE